MTGGVVMVHPFVVALPEAMGDDEFAQGFAHGFLAGPAEDDFSLSVPFDDAGFAVGEHHGIQGGFDDTPKQVPAVLELVEGFAQVLGLAPNLPFHALGEQGVGLPLLFQSAAEAFQCEVQGAHLGDARAGVHRLVQFSAAQGLGGRAKRLKRPGNADQQKEVQADDGQDHEAQGDLERE